MARYKPQDHNSLLLPVVLSEQIISGSFAFALNYLVDHELDLSALDAQFKNDEVGASAHDPRVMLKIVLLAYSQGLISSRHIEQTCARNVQFIAISGDSQPSHAHIAKFVCSLSEKIKPLFSQVLMTCDAQGLIGRDMFAIDGVKLPSNASKERSGTHEELRHRADRLEKAADKILALHQAQDKQGIAQALEPKRQARINALRQEAARTREFLASTPKRLNRKAQELKTNVTDDSPRGRQLYSQRIGTVEPVFGNIRYNKRLTRLNHRGRAKVNTQWGLYCMVHNIEKLAKTKMGQQTRQ